MRSALHPAARSVFRIQGVEPDEVEGVSGEFVAGVSKPERAKHFGSRLRRLGWRLSGAAMPHTCAISRYGACDERRSGLLEIGGWR